MKKTIAGFLFAMLLINFPHASAQTFQPNISDIIHDTQIMSNEGQRLQMVWWIPIEFWQATARSSNANEDQIREFTAALEDYNIFAVIDAKHFGVATLRYTNEEELRKTTRIFDTNGNEYSAISETELNQDTKTLLAIMKPIIANMMGDLGKNIQFLAFPAKTKGKLKIADTQGTGKLRILLGSKDFVFKLPIPSLAPRLVCNTDNETFPSNYQFCPYHGTRLSSPKTQGKSGAKN